MNQLITTEQVENILNSLKNIGDNGQRLHIKDLSYYQKAFVNKTYLAQPDPKLNYIASESNETLEFQGDAFIGAAVGHYLKHRFAPEQEGFLTKLKTRLVRSEMLYRFARYLGLGNFILLSPLVEQLTDISSNKGRNNQAIYEDCFEALCGAIIDDFGDEEGYRYVKRFTIAVIEHLVDFSDLIMNNENHKDTLQRYFQANKWPNPTYKELEDTSFPKKVNFIRGVFITKEQLEHFPLPVQQQIKNFNIHLLTKYNNISKYISEYNDGYIIGKGIGSKRITAEQDCAKNALLLCNIDLNW